MTEETKYNNLSDLGKCIVDRKIGKMAGMLTAEELASMRDLVAVRIDGYIRGRAGSDSSIVISGQAKGADGTVTTESYEERSSSRTYGDDAVPACMSQFNLSTPPTSASVRKPSRSK